MHATLNAVTLAPILFLLCAAVGVIIMNRARRDLTVEEKAAIFDAAPKRQAWLLAAMALVMAAFTLPSFHGRSTHWSFIVFGVVVLALVITPTVYYLRRLADSAVPSSYFRAVRLSMWILWVGSVLLFATLTFGTWRLLPR
jgi:cell division protein FtsW (lipid II flippase)